MTGIYIRNRTSRSSVFTPGNPIIHLAGNSYQRFPPLLPEQYGVVGGCESEEVLPSEAGGGLLVPLSDAEHLVLGRQGVAQGTGGAIAKVLTWFVAT